MLDQLKNLKSLMGVLGQAGELKGKMDEVQARLAKKTVEADAGAGAVRVVVNGKLEVKKVTLDPAMIATLSGDEQGGADKQMVEDLIAAAVNSGMKKARELVQEEMATLTGGLNLPGLDKLMGGS